jgi:hypothetical protein
MITDDLVASPPSNPSPLPKKIPIAEPEPFDGGNYPIRIFLSKVNLYFRANAGIYDTSETKALYLISKLQGTAYEWVLPILEEDDVILKDYDSLVNHLRLTFEDPDREAKAENELSTIAQGLNSVREYSARYTKLCREVDWNETALAHRFRQGLHPRIKDVLATVDLPRTVGELTILASKVEQRLAERDRERAAEEKPVTTRRHTYSQAASKPQPSKQTTSEDPPISEVWASIPEGQRRFLTRSHLGQCTYCGASDHKKETCPIRKPDASGKGKAQSQH